MWIPEQFVRIEHGRDGQVETLQRRDPLRERAGREDPREQRVDLMLVLLPAGARCEAFVD